ncbi:MAG: Ig-like domain-containing protein, partial [Planctomycetota bacterium]
SSLANGYTTLAALFAAVSPDDTAIITSTRANPFGPNETLPDDCTLDVGGEAWISGASRIASGSWSESSGVWSASLASEPHSCYWDYRQDDDDGTVTVTDLNDARAAAAIDFYGFSRPRLRAWYGDLEQNTLTPTTPAEGEWGWSSGTLYVHPPAGQSAATLAASLEYVPDTAVDGLIIGSGCTVRGGGDLTVIHTPVTTGNAGYSIISSRISGTSNNDVRGCNFVNWGWHAGVYPNFAHSGTLLVKDCVAHGIGATGQPFVAAFGDTNSDVTYTVDQNVYIPTPRIKPDGTVIDNSTDVAMYTSHDMAGSGVVTERRRRSLQLDFVQQQGVGSGVAVAGEYEDCWFVGEGAKASGNGTDVFTRCKLDRSGRGDTSSNATVLSTGNRTVRFIDSEVWTGDFQESYLLSIGSGDVVELDNTVVRVGDAGTGGNTEVFRIATGTADSLEIGSSTFINEATVDGLVGAASAGIWNANFAGVSSGGNNVFYGFVGSVTHPNGVVNPTTRQWDWWVNNIGGASTDIAPTGEPTIDTSRPTVASVALVGGNAVITFSESVSAVNDAATIASDIERATGTIVSASINGAELTLTPDGSNPFASETMLVPAAVVKNSAGNSNAAETAFVSAGGVAPTPRNAKAIGLI